VFPNCKAADNVKILEGAMSEGDVMVWKPPASTRVR